jgi:hypothetical protein
MLSVLPLTVHTLVEPLLNVTASPELAHAYSGREVLTGWLASVGKLIVWAAAALTVKELVTGVAAA